MEECVSFSCSTSIKIWASINLLLLFLFLRVCAAVVGWSVGRTVKDRSGDQKRGVENMVDRHRVNAFGETVQRHRTRMRVREPERERKLFISGDRT
jgi:hypothetical protein